MKIIELNREEIGLGIIAGFAFFWFLKWWIILTIPACGFLWALGGAKGFSKAFRRFGVAGILTLATVLSTNIYSLFCMSCAAVLSQGYGLPSIQPPDYGSPIGRFFYRLFDGNENKANIATRATLFILFWLCFLPLAWADVIAYFLSGVILMTGQLIVIQTIEGTIEVKLP